MEFGANFCEALHSFIAMREAQKKHSQQMKTERALRDNKRKFAKMN